MTSSRKTIVFVHLLNDYSGSPLVLSHVIQSLPDRKYDKILYTSDASGEGFLSGLEKVKTLHFRYSWKANAWARLFSYTFSQITLFFRLLRFFRKDVVIYVNTLLPFGAGLAGWVMGKKVIYHLHETSMKPPALKSFLRAVANYTADTVIYVSHYLSEVERLSRPDTLVIPNSLSARFTDKAAAAMHGLPGKSHRVLMLCSMKEYKGIGEFLILAGMLPAIGFDLVLNTSPEAMRGWLLEQRLPANLSVYPAQSDTHPFYQRATIVVNLSHPDKWVETFGMTILEAMSYGLPVIVPTVGGVRELVAENVNGYLADYRDLPKIADHIRTMSQDAAVYHKLSEQALIRSKLFSVSTFSESIR